MGSMGWTKQSEWLRGSDGKILLPFPRREGSVVIRFVVLLVSVLLVLLFISADCSGIQSAYGNTSCLNRSEMLAERELRRRQVRALERIADSLAIIAREISQRRSDE